MILAFLGPTAPVVAVMSWFPAEVAAWGPIKHMTILEEVIRHPELDPAVRSTLEGNLKYAKGGAVGPDLGDLDSWWSSGDASGHDCPRDLARRMWKVAGSRTAIP